MPKAKKTESQEARNKESGSDSRDELMPDANQQVVIFTEKHNMHCIEIKIATRHKHVI